MWRLAGHPSRTLRPAEATVCVVASPMAGDRDHAKAAMRGSGCSHPSRVRARLLALGDDVCPGRPVAVIDGPDADGSKTALCAGLWSPRSCAEGGADRLVRITGNAPGLQSELATGGTRGLCRRLTVPYLAHARTPHAALLGGPARRPRRVVGGGRAESAPPHAEQANREHARRHTCAWASAAYERRSDGDPNRFYRSRD